MLPNTSTVAISASFKYLDKPCQSMLLASMILHSFVNALIIITSPSMIFFTLDSMVQINSVSYSPSFFEQRIAGRCSLPISSFPPSFLSINSTIIGINDVRSMRIMLDIHAWKFRKKKLGVIYN